jgi:hypothetical protein
VSGRVSNADVIRAMEAQVETLLGMNRELITTVSAVLDAFTERRTASEPMTLSRSKLADKATGVDVTVVPQEGETQKQAAARLAEVFEGLAARFPLPDGSAHASTLGADLSDWQATLDAQTGLHAVPEPEETA